MSSPFFQQDKPQTFFVSHELNEGPLTTTIIDSSQKIADLTFGEKTQGMISIGFGKRIIVTAEVTPFSSIGTENLIEIVDYDAYKQVLLVMGKKEPQIDTAVHWMIHHAKQEIGAIILIKNNIDKRGNIHNLIPSIDANPNGTILDRSKTILEALQNEKTLYLEEEGILLTGRTINEIHQHLTKLRGLTDED